MVDILKLISVSLSNCSSSQRLYTCIGRCLFYGLRVREHPTLKKHQTFVETSEISPTDSEIENMSEQCTCDLSQFYDASRRIYFLFFLFYLLRGRSYVLPSDWHFHYVKSCLQYLPCWDPGWAVGRYFSSLQQPYGLLMMIPGIYQRYQWWWQIDSMMCYSPNW